MENHRYLMVITISFFAVNNKIKKIESQKRKLI